MITLTDVIEEQKAKDHEFEAAYEAEIMVREIYSSNPEVKPNDHCNWVTNMFIPGGH